MFGVPVNLQVNSVESFTNYADSGFPKIQQREIFYSVKSGNWSDANLWQTASGRVGIYPNEYDDVFIRHSVTHDYTYNSSKYGVGVLPINNLYVSEGGTIFMAGSNTSLYVNGNVNCYGTINMASVATNSNFSIKGNNNFINNFVRGGANSSFVYVGVNQSILPLDYGSLTISSSSSISVSNLSSNLTVNSNLTTSSGMLNLGVYDLSVLGTTFIGGRLIKPTTGSLLFVGLCDVNNSAGVLTLDLSGNPNVEFRGGLRSRGSSINTGTGTFSFTTNNQSISPQGSVGENFYCNIVIGAGVTLTCSLNFTMSMYNSINGANASSKLENRGTISFLNSASVSSMSTGIIDFTTYANTVLYGGDYTATFPSTITSFYNLQVSGSGVKSLGNTTTITNGLTILGSTTSTAVFDAAGQLLTINGTTTSSGGNATYRPTFRQSGSGRITFNGPINCPYNAMLFLDFNGNPNVHVYSNISYSGTDNFANYGTGTWTFKANSTLAIFDGPAAAAGSLTYGFYNIIIDPGVTVTTANAQAQSTSRVYIMNNITISAGASYVNRNILVFNNTTTVSGTGTLDITTNPNTFVYLTEQSYTMTLNSFYNFAMWRRPGFGIASPVLTANASFSLLGDLSLFEPTGSLTPATFDISAITNLNVPGNFYNTLSKLKKSTSGSITFNGTFTDTYGGASNKFDFSGNPTITFKNNTSFGSITSLGTGQITFSTNTLTFSSLSAQTFDNNILISGAITVLTSMSGVLTLTGTLNGDNASSTFRIGSNNNITYSNSSVPMSTGVLDTSTNLNTWTYGNSNQNIKGLPTTSPKQVYRNLTLNGGGVKTLQGYVSVLNTYTLTTPATLSLNGFTLTNP